MLQVTGGIAKVIRNDDKLYEGDLKHYFKIVCGARNVLSPYHNIRHMLHVTWLCASACEFYRGTDHELNPRSARNLLIAALMHDFDHTGRTGNDDLNIEYALRGLEKHILDEDRPWIGDVRHMINGTQFPYVIHEVSLTFPARILRDADASQSFSVAWIHQVIYGLSAEMGKTPLEVLEMQKGYLSKLSFCTDWAKFLFKNEGQIEAKIAEAEELLELLK